MHSSIVDIALHKSIWPPYLLIIEARRFVAPTHRPDCTPPPTIWLWFRQSPPPFAGTWLRNPPDPPPPAGFVFSGSRLTTRPGEGPAWLHPPNTKRRPACFQGAASRFASVSEVVRNSPLPSCHDLQRLLRRNDNPAKLAYWKSLDIGSPPFDLLNTPSIWGDLQQLARANHSRASPVSCARPISCSGGSRSGHRRRLDQPVSTCRPARRNRPRRSCAGCGA